MPEASRIHRALCRSRLTRSTRAPQFRGAANQAGACAWRTGLLLLCGLLCASVALADSAEPAVQPTAEVAADDAAESSCVADAGRKAALQIQAHYDGVRDLRADFVQSSQSASFGGELLMSPDTKTGKVVFAKPGKMRWTYEDPEPSVVVSNGRLLWVYDVAGKTVTKLEVTAGFLSGAALQFLLGDGQILDSFDVSASRCAHDRIELDLLPKQDATYERLGLVADPRTGNILATSVLDLFGNLTEIEFRDTKTNRGPDPKTFEFEAPEGVEVLEYSGIPAS